MENFAALPFLFLFVVLFCCYYKAYTKRSSSDSTISKAINAKIGEKSTGKPGRGGKIRRQRLKRGSVISYMKRVKKLSPTRTQEKSTRTNRMT